MTAFAHNCAVVAGAYVCICWPSVHVKENQCGESLPANCKLDVIPAEFKC